MLFYQNSTASPKSSDLSPPSSFVKGKQLKPNNKSSSDHAVFNLGKVSCLPLHYLTHLAAILYKNANESGASLTSNVCQHVGQHEVCSPLHLKNTHIHRQERNNLLPHKKHSAFSSAYWLQTVRTSGCSWVRRALQNTPIKLKSVVIV